MSKPSRFVEWLTVIAQVATLTALIVGIASYQRDLKEEQHARVRDAWQLVTASATGNSGKGPALEYLNSIDDPKPFRIFGFTLFTQPRTEAIRLTGINFFTEPARTDLERVRLREARMSYSNFRNADLEGADFTRAVLIRSHFESAWLKDVSFEDADLHCATFSPALVGFPPADVRGATFRGADLRHVDLSDTNITAKQLAGACFDSTTKVTWKKGVRRPAPFCERRAATTTCPNDWWTEKGDADRRPAATSSTTKSTFQP